MRAAFPYLVPQAAFLHVDQYISWSFFEFEIAAPSYALAQEQGRRKEKIQQVRRDPAVETPIINDRDAIYSERTWKSNIVKQTVICIGAVHTRNLVKKIQERHLRELKYLRANSKI